MGIRLKKRGDMLPARVEEKTILGDKPGLYLFTPIWTTNSVCWERAVEKIGLILYFGRENTVFLAKRLS